MKDNVNHPGHCETGKYECIEVMQEAIGVEETKGFCLCNAFKYIYRCKSKHSSPVEDVKKAVWYLNKFLELESLATIRHTAAEERCVCCGAVIPEGRQVCPNCENRSVTLYVTDKTVAK